MAQEEAGHRDREKGEIRNDHTAWLCTRVHGSLLLAPHDSAYKKPG